MDILVELGIGIIGFILLICIFYLIDYLEKKTDGDYGWLGIISGIIIISSIIYFFFSYTYNTSLYICKNNQIYIKYDDNEYYQFYFYKYCKCVDSNKKNIIIGNYVYENFGHKDEITKMNIYVRDRRTKESYLEKVNKDITIDHQR